MKSSVSYQPLGHLSAAVRFGLALTCLGGLGIPSVQADPQGGKVTAGQAEILQALGKTTIKQGSDRAVIEWESFSIGAGEITQFIQPGSNSAALNRVMGASPSLLNGILRANGNVLLINQNGVVVGPNGMVDVGGFLASTLDVSNDEFLRGGDLTLKGTSEASVQNFGTIKAATGDVFLVGRDVENHGVLGAFQGHVGLAAGNNVLIKSTGNERVFVSAGEGRVTNTGEIASAVAELKAHGNAYAMAINNTGVVRATGVDQRGGGVFLRAAGDISTTGEVAAINQDGSGGTIQIATGAGEIKSGGLLNASGTSAKGGSITLANGGALNLVSGSVVEANGTSGGSIEIGGTAGQSIQVGDGAKIMANGLTGKGGRIDVNGGEIVVYRNSTLGANGETSGGAVSVGGTGRVQIDGTVSATGATENGGSASLVGTSVIVGNEGSVNVNGATQGGSIAMNAADLNRVEGSVSATGATGGLISLQAGRKAEVAGQVSAVGSSLAGGRIDVIANEVSIETGALLDGSGALAGGSLNVGGSFQGKADPTLRNALNSVVAEGATLRVDSSLGSAGRAVVWSDGTTLFSGDVSARALGATGRGGLIEVSGKQNLLFRGTVSAASVGGQSGTVLFDPGDVYIGASSSNIPIASLNTILQGNTSVIIATQSGSIIVQDLGLADTRHNAIQWTSDASLGLFASENIFVANHIRNSGKGSINLIAGWEGLETELIAPLPLSVNTAISTALTVEVGSTLKMGTILPIGSVLNGTTLAVAQNLGSDTAVTGLTTVAAGGTLATGSVITGTGAFGIGATSVEDRWESYVEAEKFGDQGSIFIGRADLNRHIEVGSRYGNTNVAANSLVMTTFQGNAEPRWTQLGFHDSGATLLPRAGGTGVRGLDLHNGLNDNIVRSIRQGNTDATINASLDTRVDPALGFLANSTTLTLRNAGAGGRDSVGRCGHRTGNRSPHLRHRDQRKCDHAFESDHRGFQRQHQRRGYQLLLYLLRTRRRGSRHCRALRSGPLGLQRGGNFGAEFQLYSRDGDSGSGWRGGRCAPREREWPRGRYLHELRQ